MKTIAEIIGPPQTPKSIKIPAEENLMLMRYLLNGRYLRFTIEAVDSVAGILTVRLGKDLKKLQMSSSPSFTQQLGRWAHKRTVGLSEDEIAKFLVGVECYCEPIKGRSANNLQQVSRAEWVFTKPENS